MKTDEKDKLDETATVKDRKDNQNNLCEMIKIKIKDVVESIDKESGGSTFSITIPEDKIGKITTLIGENEIIRIIKALDLKNLNAKKDNNGRDCDFPFINDLIAMEVSSGEYKKNQKGLITIIFETKRGLKIIQNQLYSKDYWQAQVILETRKLSILKKNYLKR